MTPRRRDAGRRQAGRPGRPPRRTPGQEEKIRVLIVGEGEQTEHNYFIGLRGAEQMVRDRFVLDVLKGQGGSATDVVQLAVERQARKAHRGREYDEVWCVFDVEGEALRTDVRAAREFAGRHGIQLAVSNPCFEVWFLAHFRRSSRPFANAKKVSEELDAHWRKAFRCDYEKNDPTHYQRLATATRTAIQNARSVRETDHRGAGEVEDCNSSTDVYRLVDHLLGSDAASP
jgi:hypothetical protein